MLLLCLLLLDTIKPYVNEVMEHATRTATDENFILERRFVLYSLVVIWNVR